MVTQCTTPTSAVSDCLKIDFNGDNFRKSPQKSVIRDSFLSRAKVTRCTIDQLIVTITVLRKTFEEETFGFFAVSEPSVKVFSANFCGHTHIIIGRTGAIREVFSAKFSFCTETRNISTYVHQLMHTWCCRSTHASDHACGEL